MQTTAQHSKAGQSTHSVRIVPSSAQVTPLQLQTGTFDVSFQPWKPASCKWGPIRKQGGEGRNTSDSDGGSGLGILTMLLPSKRNSKADYTGKLAAHTRPEPSALRTVGGGKLVPVLHGVPQLQQALDCAGAGVAGVRGKGGLEEQMGEGRRRGPVIAWQGMLMAGHVAAKVEANRRGKESHAPAHAVQDLPPNQHSRNKLTIQVSPPRAARHLQPAHARRPCSPRARSHWQARAGLAAAAAAAAAGGCWGRCCLRRHCRRRLRARRRSRRSCAIGGRAAAAAAPARAAAGWLAGGAAGSRHYCQQACRKQLGPPHAAAVPPCAASCHDNWCCREIRGWVRKPAGAAGVRGGPCARGPVVRGE